MAKLPTVAIVGCGRAGGSIGIALERAGYRIGAVWSQSREGRERARQLVSAPVLGDLGDVAATADVVILSVPDGAITEVARQLAEQVRDGQLVVHTSGAMTVDALAPASERGASIGSMHPLQTLPDPHRGADALDGAAVAVTCSEEDRSFLHRLAAGWGGLPFPLPDDVRVLYHAAAVFASNYVVTTVWAATKLFEELGVGNARPLLGPLVRTTVENVLTQGSERAVTGPVVRGDVETLRRHVATLGELGGQSEELVGAYRALARLTAELAGADVDAVREATA